MSTSAHLCQLNKMVEIKHGICTTTVMSNTLFLAVVSCYEIMDNLLGPTDIRSRTFHGPVAAQGSDSADSPSWTYEICTLQYTNITRP